MVEFGLKLEDNKVAEWSDHYIDYEKLKAIVDKLKSATKKRDELFKRKPELAKEIEQQFEEGEESVGAMSTRTSFEASSAVLLEDIAESSSIPKKKEVALVDKVPAAASSEKEPLLLKDKALLEHHKYGSNASLTSGGGEIRRTLSGTFPGVSGYLNNARYERSIKETLKQINAQHVKFETQLLAEVEKVNSFYNKKVKEMQNRLDMLIESVDSSETQFGVIQNSIRQKQQKRKTVAQMMVTQFKSMVGTEEQREEIKEQTKTLYVSDEEDDLVVIDDDEDKKVQAVETNRSRLRESDSIQRALGDHYRTVKLLHNFSILNYTGFVKITKKFNKAAPRFKGKFKEVTSDSNICNESKEIAELEERLEQIYASWFCDGNVREARAQLLPKRGDGLQMDWSQLRLGYRLGMCAILMLWVCWDCIWGLVKQGQTTIGGRNAFPVFRACGGLLLLHWFWGASVYVWTRYRINYIFLFDLNPNTANSPVSIFNDAVDETLVFLVLMLLYYKAGAHDIPELVPAGYFPMLLILYAVGCLIFPLKTRGSMWKSIFDVVTAPLNSPTFFTIYIADVFTSMVKVFQDIAWALMFVISGDFLESEDSKGSGKHKWQHAFWYKNVLIPLVCLFPLWIRFNQCLRKYTDTGKRMPNLANALKYAMSQTVTLFGAFHPLYLMKSQRAEHKTDLFQLFWMALFVSSSLYSFWWDVYMDWGLGSFKHGFLSPRLMFPRRSVYYIVMIADIILRFMWVLTLVPPQSGARFEVPQYLTAVTMAMELTRRTMWGFFRLENEHRNNTNQYRRVSFVPLHFNTGHQHKYKQEREHVGWVVLLEVALVSLVVIGISVSSVIAAQRATRDYNEL